jgi:hypothetical protein
MRPNLVNNIVFGTPFESLPFFNLVSLQPHQIQSSSAHEEYAA